MEAIQKKKKKTGKSNLIKWFETKKKTSSIPFIFFLGQKIITRKYIFKKKKKTAHLKCKIYFKTFFLRIFSLKKSLRLIIGSKRLSVQVMFK